MFVDNTKKIICLSVPGTECDATQTFLQEQFELHSISVDWFKKTPVLSDEQRLAIKEFDKEKVNTQNTVIDGTNTGIVASNHSELIEDGTVGELILKNCVTSPISDYKIYAICREPIMRIISVVEAHIYDSHLKMIEHRAVLQRSILEPEAIKESVLNFLTRNFVENIGIFKPENINLLSSKYYSQTHWLKHNSQLVSDVYKHDNYASFVSDLCVEYNLDSSLYDDAKRITSRKTNLSLQNIQQEIKDKILERYTEDQTLYDSL